MAAKKRARHGKKHEMMEGSKERKMEYGSKSGGMKKKAKKK
jgi:hypothetical protein